MLKKLALTVALVAPSLFGCGGQEIQRSPGILTALAPSAGLPVVRPADANGTPPAVAIAAPNVTSSSQASEQVKITFTDSAGIDPSSISTDNITVLSQTTGDKLSVTAATLSPSDGSAGL